MSDNTSGRNEQNIPTIDDAGTKRNIPVADLDFGALCAKAADRWQQNPWLTLLWTTKDEFAQITAQYNTLLVAQGQQRKDRPQLTGKLSELDQQIDDATDYIKGYLKDKYGKRHAPGYYPAFGIVKKGGKLIVPKDRDARRAALASMITAISDHGFGNNTYGNNFWRDIKTRFDDFLDQANETDSGVSQKTGNKNLVKKDLKQTLNALVLILKGNYPDTWKTELRNWGFQKEKY